MKQISKKLSIILMSVALIASQNAFAARMGKSRSMGMQRNVTTQSNNTSYNNANYRPANPGAAPAAAQQNRGPGIGTAVAGAAAGAVGGYMLGKAMNSNNGEKMASSQVSNQEAPTTNESHIPWGTIAILAMLLVIGLMIFRRRTTPQANNANFGNMSQQPQTGNNFEIPTLRKDNTSFNNSNGQQANSTSAQPIVNPAYQRMADGVETQYFLRQAKGMFLHIQSMNTPDNVYEVEKYMTPDLYREIKQSINENDFVADFSQLDCQLLDSATENNNYVASVKFFGKISESPNSPVVDFNEIWNFIKPVGIDGAKWIVAGIQQPNTSN